MGEGGQRDTEKDRTTGTERNKLIGNYHRVLYYVSSLKTQRVP